MEELARDGEDLCALVVVEHPDLCALVVGEHPDLCALVVDLVRVLVVVEHPEKLTDLAFESFPEKTTIR